MAVDDARVGWSELPAQAQAFRAAHVVWGVAGMASLGYIWLCALTGRRDRALVASLSFLSIEGLALVVGRGDCPFGPLQRELGDPVPMFELVLPPRAARAAIPVLTGVTLIGLLAVALRYAAATLRPRATGPARDLHHTQEMAAEPAGGVD